MQKETQTIKVRCDSCGAIYEKPYPEDGIGNYKGVPCDACGVKNYLYPDERPLSNHSLAGSPPIFQEILSRSQYYFNAVEYIRILMRNFSFVTVGNKIYRFNQIQGTYDPCEEWLRTMIFRGLGNHAKQRFIDEIVGMLKIETTITQYPTPSPTLIPFNNGVYDIESGLLRDYSQDDYFFSRLEINYSYGNPSADLDNFFKELVDDDLTRMWLIDWATLVFVRKIVTAKMLLLVGAGSNGKSLYADILKSALGENLYTSSSLHDLHDFRLEPLYSRRPYLNVSGELSRKGDLDQDVIKKLVSGESITIDRKHKDLVTFSSTTKFLALTNELPESLRDLSDGWCRRILPIYLEKQFKENESYREKLVSKENVGAWVSSVIIPNIKTVLERKGITEPMGTDEVRSFFAENLNSIFAFCEAHLVCVNEKKTSADDIQKAYAIFCKNEKLRKTSNVALGRGIKRYFKNKLKLRWSDPSPVDLVTSRIPGSIEYEDVYSNVVLANM